MGRRRVHSKKEKTATAIDKRNDLLDINGTSRDGQVTRLQSIDQVMKEAGAYPELDALYKVALQLQEQKSPGALAQEVVRILERTPGYERCAVLIVDRDGKKLKPFALAHKGYGTDFAQAYEAYLATHDLRMGGGVAGQVARDGKALCIGDIQSDRQYGEFHDDIRSVVCAPIQIADVVLGVVCVESDRPNEYSELDRQLLETVARQMAVAIQNAHLISRASQVNEASLDKTDQASLPTFDSPGVQAHETLLESESQFSKIVEELQAQNEELNAFNHTVAHDLKNPLSILLGFAEVLVQDYGDGEDEVLDQGIRVILENGRRMESIINELLLLAEVRMLDEITIEPLNMIGIVVETRKRLSNQIGEHGARIVAPAVWPSALGHRPWVEEIWVNYLSNAIRYGGTPPRVELGAIEQPDGMIRFWVRDNGEGISPEDQKRLFVPFTKLNQVNTKGHGLGLSIVHRITRKLGGQVGVESDPGKGSVFWFTLPKAD